MQVALNPRFETSAVSPHTHNDLYGKAALADPTLATSENKMDQKGAISANGSSSTFK